MTGHGIDEQGNRRGINAIGGKLGAFRHCTGDDGGRGGAKYRLENGVGPQGYARGKNVAVIPHNERVDPAKGRRSRAEHDAKADQPIQRCADAEIHQVFHQDIAGVLGSCEACLAHGKARLHEENQGRAQQDPDGVCRRIRHTAHFRFCRISNKKGAGCIKHTLAPCWNDGILVRVDRFVNKQNNLKTIKCRWLRSCSAPGQRDHLRRSRARFCWASRNRGSCGPGRDRRIQTIPGRAGFPW